MMHNPTGTIYSFEVPSTNASFAIRQHATGLEGVGGMTHDGTTLYGAGRTLVSGPLPTAAPTTNVRIAMADRDPRNLLQSKDFRALFFIP